MTRVRTRRSRTRRSRTRRSRTRRSRMRRINRFKKQYYLGSRSSRYKNKKLRKSRKKNRKLYGGSLNIGDTVKAKYKNSGKYNVGSIMKVNKDGTYDVRFDRVDLANCQWLECNTRTSIPKENIKAAVYQNSRSHATARSSMTSPSYKSFTESTPSEGLKLDDEGNLMRQVKARWEKEEREAEEAKRKAADAKAKKKREAEEAEEAERKAADAKAKKEKGWLWQGF